MKEITVTIGKTYAVTTASSCTVTDADGRELCTANAGEQAYFVANSGTVTLSDDSASVTLATFKQALAALGLLGGGKDKLPGGYMRVEFLQGTRTQSINTGVVKSGEYRAICDYSGSDVLLSGNWFGWNYKKDNVTYQNLFRFYDTSYLGRFTHDSTYGYILPPNYNQQGYIGTAKNRLESTEVVNRVVLNGNVVYLSSYAPSEKSNENPKNEPVRLYFLNGVKIYAFSIFNDQTKDIDLIPTLDSSGTPCMFDLVTPAPFRSEDRGQFIVGMTLSQASQLGRKLPSGGGELTVSLPEGYDVNERVVESLLVAEEKGWVLIIQTYTPEAAPAVRTFGLRRIWVRRRENDKGSYVAANGTRWQVDWCVDIIGADPETLGYERFRSIEAATAYWELEPYIDPNVEEELLTETE